MPSSVGLLRLRRASACVPSRAPAIHGRERPSRRGITEILQPLNRQIVAFTEAQAAHVGDLRPETKSSGLSLGIRACLALAEALGAPALSADRDWRGVTIGVTIQVIR